MRERDTHHRHTPRESDASEAFVRKRRGGRAASPRRRARQAGTRRAVESVTLYCTALSYTTLDSVTHLGVERVEPACEVEQRVALRDNILHYITLHYITLYYITLHYSTLHYVSPCGTEERAIQRLMASLYLTRGDRRIHVREPPIIEVVSQAERERAVRDSASRRPVAARGSPFHSRPGGKGHSTSTRAQRRRFGVNPRLGMGEPHGVGSTRA